MILVAAIVIGGLAALLLWSYVNGIQDRAYGKAKRVKVFIVKTSGVTKGTFGEEVKSGELVEEDEIPQRFYPDNAIKSLDDIAGKQAINNLAPNQIVTTDMFANPEQVQTTFADRLEKIRGVDQVAISVRVSEMHGVAGLLQPGDYVNLMVRECDLDAAAAAAAALGIQPGGQGAQAQSQLDLCDTLADVRGVTGWNLLYQKAQILAVDRTPVAGLGEVQPASEDGEDTATTAATQRTGLITLIVPARAAKAIAWSTSDIANEAPNLYMALVGRDYKPTEVPTDILPDAPLPGEDPTKLTPYGPDGPGK